MLRLVLDTGLASKSPRSSLVGWCTYFKSPVNAPAVVKPPNTDPVTINCTFAPTFLVNADSIAIAVEPDTTVIALTASMSESLGKVAVTTL